MSENGKGKRWLKPREAAALMGISLWALYRLVNTRGFPGRKIPGVGVRVDAVRLDRWLEKRTS